METTTGNQSFAGILETAMKLANEEDEDSGETNKVSWCARGRLASLHVPKCGENELCFPSEEECMKRH